MLFVHCVRVQSQSHSNRHLHQHIRDSSYTSVDMLNMFTTQDFLLKVAFLIRVGTDISLAQLHSIFSTTHHLYTRIARQSYIYKTCRLSFHSIFLIIFDFYTFTCFKCSVCRTYENFIPFTGWLLLLAF